MNTPSKEALDAAFDLFKHRYCFGSDNDNAAIIDRHFEPLRQRAEQDEARVKELDELYRDLRVAYEQNAEQCVKLNRELGLKKETTEWLNGTTIQRARAERAEDRVKELEAAILRLQQANTDLVEVMQEIRDRPDISALSMRLLATNVLIRHALDKRVECARCVELAGVLRGLLKNAERDGDTRLAVQKARSVLARHAVGEPAVALESPHA